MSFFYSAAQSKLYFFVTGVIVVYSLLLTTAVFPSQAASETAIDNQVIKGLDYCYHFKWKNAEDLFRQIIQQYPDDPRGYHYLSSIYFWYYLSNKNEQDYNTFKKYSDEAIEKASDENDNNSNASLLYILGSNYNYRTVAFAKAGEYVSAVWAAKKSESYLSDCLEKDSSFYDAYLGLGLYNFAMSKIPSGFKWALNLAGISGNEHKGIRYIRITADKGRFAKTEAQYYLSQVLAESSMDYITASRFLDKLVNRYPENILFIYSSGVVDLKERQLAQAEKKLSAIVKRREQKFLQVISFSDFLLGDINFRRNQFDEAKTHYISFLNSAADKDYTGIASFRLGLCYELTGDRNSAKNWYKKSSSGNADLEDDTFAKRKGSIYLKRTLSDNEITAIKGSNLLEAGKYNEAAELLSGVADVVKAGWLKSEIYLSLSDAAFGLEKYNDSFNYAVNADKFSSDEEAWVKPFANFYAARALVKMNRKPEAAKFFDKADDYNRYDYSKKLEAMINYYRR